MSCDHLGPTLEDMDGLGQLGVVLVRGDEERIVRIVSLRVVFHTPSIAMNSGE